ncbi:MAG: Fic family protein [Acidobacteriota bacterium]
MEALEKVQQLKADLDSFRPLKPEAEARIMQKFRLDWNYHSNNIEGNSLTYGETKAFILFGITAGKKPFKDYLEIKGHNEAINWVLSLVKGETELTEVFIRELHTLLLKESSESFAQTPDGKPTKKKIEVGKYKTLPNHVLQPTGEMFYFASPEETPAKMHELIDWYRAEREKTDVNPIILATFFHYRFIRIHPFDDGNGRTARILMNFILMQNGFPPVIIKTEYKENYYGVLRLADVGELEPFIEYVANNLVHSLEIMIRGAKGEDIEEADDLDKELALLEKRFVQTRNIKEKIWSNENVRDTLYLLFPNLIKQFVLVCKKFDRFYLDSSFSIKLITQSIKNLKTKEVVLFKKLRKELSEDTSEEIGNLATITVVPKVSKIHIPEIIGLQLIYDFKTLLNTNVGNEFSSEIDIEFDRDKYSIISVENEFGEDKPYLTPFDYEEISKLMKLISNTHKENLEKIFLIQNSRN